MFQEVLFPPEGGQGNKESSELKLEKVMRFAPNLATSIVTSPLVIFDFETTGLDHQNDHIIEIGGLKTINGEIVEEFSALIESPVALSEVVTQITGITSDMLVGMPRIDEVLPKFLNFIEGTILVAHNAEFDMSFLRNACLRQGIQLNWPSFCTLKLARALLPDLESKNLDTLAEHYGLTFEARHRSIGDCKVTSAVLQAMLSEHGNSYNQWGALQSYAVK
jgi:DNA polymerase III epsilon subunit family exonuclease